MKIDDYIKKFNKQLSIVGAIVIIIAVYGVFAMEAANADYYEPGEGSGGGGGGGAGEYKIYNDSANGDAQEHESYNHSFDTGGYVVDAAFTLTWTDEADAFPGYENEGDTFTLKVVDPTGQYESSGTETNAHGESGEIRLEFNITNLAGEPDADVFGDWNVTVTLDEVGDHHSPSPFDPVYFDDDSNTYSLSVEMSYRLG